MSVRDLTALRADLDRLTRSNRPNPPPAVPLGLAGIDSVLPWGGMPSGGLHEIFGASRGDDAAAGFALLLLSRFAQDGRLVLWCRNRATAFRQGLPPLSPYAPGIVDYGLDPGRLLLVQTTRDVDALWTVEETLKEPSFAAVLGELTEIDLTGSRRLQLAAEAHGVACLLLRPGRTDPVPTAALTRWHVAARPSIGDRPAWQLDLLRCRGGKPGSWVVVRKGLFVQTEN